MTRGLLSPPPPPFMRFAGALLLLLLLQLFGSQYSRAGAIEAKLGRSSSSSSFQNTNINSNGWDLGKPYAWEEYVPEQLQASSAVSGLEFSRGGALASSYIKQPVYVSITTIHMRLSKVIRVIRDVFSGSFIPDHMYLFVSREKYILDSGITHDDIPDSFDRYIQSGVLTVVFTNNTGPHRKLLPLLQKFWYDDVVIITFDDDKGIAPMTIMKLINYYVENGRNSIVGLRVRRMGLCGRTDTDLSNSDPSHPDTRMLKFKDYDACNWPRVQNSFSEMLVLPTGSGGVLYRPKFFHPIVFDETLRLLTKFNDDLTFRLSTMINEVYVVNGCCESLGSCSIPHVHIADKIEDADMINDFITSASKSGSMKLWDSNANMNSKMWLAATLYLKSIKLLKTDSLIQKYLYSDRSECFSERDLNNKVNSYESLADAFLDSSFRCNQCHMCQTYQGVRDFLKYRLSNTSIAPVDQCGVYVCNPIETSRYRWNLQGDSKGYS